MHGPSRLQKTIPPPLLRHFRNPPEPPPWEEPTAEQLQSRIAFQLARAKRSKTISSHFLKQWQSSWEAYRLTKTNPTAALTTPLSQKKTPHTRRSGRSREFSGYTDPYRENWPGRLSTQATCSRCHLTGMPMRVAQTNGKAYHYVLPLIRFRQSGPNRSPGQLYATCQYSSRFEEYHVTTY